MHSLLTLLFLHVISKFVQTHLKQYKIHKLEYFLFGIHFHFSNNVVWLTFYALLTSKYICFFFGINFLIETRLRDGKFIKYVHG